MKQQSKDQPAHTPGPWTVNKQGSVTAIAPLAAITSSRIAVMNNWQPRFEAQQKANARLMASAPELLEMVQEFISACNSPSKTSILSRQGIVAKAQVLVTKATKNDWLDKHLENVEKVVDRFTEPIGGQDD